MNNQAINSALGPTRTVTVAFYLLTFFLVFGTSTNWFPDEFSSVVDFQTSNVVNKLVFPIIYLLCLPSVYQNRHQILRLIASERWLTGFLIWCLLTTLWSAYPSSTLKRWIQLAGAITVCCCFLLENRDFRSRLRPLAFIYALYLPMSLIIILTIPAATGVEPPGWRGIAGTKNVFGQFAMFGTAICFFAAQCERGRVRVFFMFLMLLSMVLLIGSKSTTTLAALAIAASLSWFTAFSRQLGERGVAGFGALFIAMSLISLAAVALAVAVFAPEIIATVFAAGGKDLTFTGRTDLWAMILDEAGRHPWTGFGFGAYWVGQNTLLYNWYYLFNWLPTEAHQGYLDIFNETGYPGLVLFIGTLGHYFLSAIRDGHATKWFWVVIALVIINFQESILLLAAGLPSVLFVIAYLSNCIERLMPSEPDADTSKHPSSPLG